MTEAMAHSHGWHLEDAHINPRGMGGIGKKADPARHETICLCAIAGNNGDSCHALLDLHHMRLEKDGERLLLTFADEPTYDTVRMRRDKTYVPYKWDGIPAWQVRPSHQELLPKDPDTAVGGYEEKCDRFNE